MITSDPLKIEISGQQFLLLAEKALLWVEKGGLIISDVHLGKAGHFRKHGIALPETKNDENLELINQLIKKHKPDWILFLGDLFHSTKNSEWNTFKLWRASHSGINIFLVMGNHELYDADVYEELGITCMNYFEDNDFLFLHDKAQAKTTKGKVIFSGHIHPAIKLRGKGRQSIRVPCFIIEDDSVILPAFGTLTGTYTLKPSKKARVYGVLDQQIMKIQGP